MSASSANVCKPQIETKPNPFTCRDNAGNLDTLPEIRQEVSDLSCSNDKATTLDKYRLACRYATKAEVYKREGNYAAEACYKKAIEADPGEPAYELFYADYLRNYRGTGVPLQGLSEPGSPLIPQAQQHYVAAQKKLHALATKKGGGRCDEVKTLETRDKAAACPASEGVRYKGTAFDLYIQDTYRSIQRGLANLYQRDGIALTPWTSNVDGVVDPLVFFSTSNEFGRSTNDFGSVDDVRSFSSEAQFAGSPKRNRSLSKKERQSIARDWLQAQTVNRIRIRPGSENLPSFDAFFSYQHADDQQVKDFYDPTHTTDVSLHALGAALEQSFNLAPLGDLTIGAGYTRTEREGIVEFRPAKSETIDEFTVAAAASRYVGSDRITLSGRFTYQDIDPDSVVAGGANDGDHDRLIYGASLSYLAPYLVRVLPSAEQQDPFARLYRTEGVKFFAGFAHDVEAFGDIDIEKDDYFIGASILGWTPFGKNVAPFGVLSPPKFDVTVQPTIFTAETSGDNETDDDNDENNAQYRTNVVVVYTLFDEEREVREACTGHDKQEEDCPVHDKQHWIERPRPVSGLDLASLKLAVPFRHDVAMNGTSAFENVRIGVALDAKLTSYGLGGTTILASAGYDYQNFYNIDKELYLFFVRISFGF